MTTTTMASGSHLLELQRNSRPSIRVFRTAAEIEEVREIWTAWQHHPNSDIDFYLMIHRSWPKASQPYILVLYRNSRPEAMLIGRIEDGRIEMKLGYAPVFAPKVRILNIVYQGLLGNVSTENSEAMIGEIREALGRGEAEIAVFRYLRMNSPVYRSATTSVHIWQRDFCLAPQTHRGMTLPGSIDEFLSRFSGKVRKNHRLQAKRLQQDHGGHVQVRCFRRTSELDQLFHDAEAVASRTYQRGLGVGFEDSQEMRNRLLLEAERGGLLAYVLYVADRPTAFWIGTLYQETFFSSFMGYDPALAGYSPGTFLLLKVIEGLCAGDGECRVKGIDFGLGDAPYKSLLGDSEWNEATVHLFGSGARSLALNAVRTPMLLLNQFLKNALAKTDFLGRVKRIWRRRARLRATPTSQA